jgi:carboxymethylenebutenolidase
MLTFLSGGVPIRLQAYEASAPGPHPAVILLHGAGGNVDHWLQYLAPAINRLGISIYAVHYFDRTKTQRADPTLIQDGIQVPLWLAAAADALSHIAALPNVDKRRIALLGISLGAFLSLALATQAKPIRAVIDISGGLAEPWSTRATSAFPHTLILHGEADTTVPISHARNLDDLLNRLEIRHQTSCSPTRATGFPPPPTSASSPSFPIF